MAQKTAISSQMNRTKFNTSTFNDKIITLKEVSSHDAPSNCWIVLYDRVYNISDFFFEHPGGGEILFEYAGRDATCAFRSVGHSEQALIILNRFLIGQLPTEERIFRKTEGYRISDLPE